MSGRRIILSGYKGMGWKEYETLTKIKGVLEDCLVGGDTIFGMLNGKINAANVAIMAMLFKAIPCHVQQCQHLHT